MPRHHGLIGLVVFLTVALLTAPAWALRKNGFDLTGALIPPAKIHGGGPAKDGIPALDHPKFIPASQAKAIRANDRVLGLEIDGVAKAYPINILNWHEIVNDQFGNQPVVITYCPLCGTGMGFDSQVAGTVRHFGVSGLLYNSDVLLYDRESQSLWSQVMGQAVTGKLKGERLTLLPLQHTSWGDWQQRHPDTLLLSRDTGFVRNYSRDPYEGYAERRATYFSVSHNDPRYHPKERVVGLQIDGKYWVYPFSELSRTDGTIQNKKGVKVVYDHRHQTAQVFGKDGEEIPTVIGYWFAWMAFHPDSTVYQAPK